MNLFGFSSSSRTPRSFPVPAESPYRYAKRRHRMLFSVLDTLCRPAVDVARTLRPTVHRNNPRSILIVQLDHIGDAVLTTPLLRALRERFPNTSIDVLASLCNREIFESNPHVRQVHVSKSNWHTREPRKQSYFGEVFRLGRAMRRFRYDLGLDPRGDFLALLVLWFAGIPRRVGWSCGGGGFLLTDVGRWDPRRHEIELRRALLEPLGIRAPAFAPELFPSWADIYHVRECLAADIRLRRPLTVLHVGAGTPAKHWPASHLASLASDWTDRSGGSVILVGDSRDTRQCVKLARSTCHVSNWTGRLKLMHLAALLAEADLFIGTDSGPAHIAAAMGTPTLVLFSGTNRTDCWRPIGPNVRVVNNPVPCSPCHLKDCTVPGHPCMTGILPRQVLGVAHELMRTSAGPRRPITNKSINQGRADERPLSWVAVELLE